MSLHENNSCHTQVLPDGRGVTSDMGTVLPLCAMADRARDPFEQVGKLTPPEIDGRCGTWSKESDIFQFGVLVFNTMVLVQRDVLCAFAFTFVSAVEDLVRDCLELEPRRRPPSTDVILRRLDSLLRLVLETGRASPVIPFHEACERGDLAAVLRSLRDSTIDVDEQKRIRQTPLFLAMENGHALIAHELLSCNARLDIRSHTWPDRSGTSLLPQPPSSCRSPPHSAQT